MQPDSISTQLIDEAEFARLLEQRELLDATELVAKMGHCQWDYQNNRLISCSQGYARIFGGNVDEIIDLQSSWDRSIAQIHPDDQDRYLATYENQRATGNYSIEYRFFRLDGEIRWVRETGILKLNKNGDVTDAFGIVRILPSSWHIRLNSKMARSSLARLRR